MQQAGASVAADDESPDVREEAAEVAGDGWMDAANERLGGRTPQEVVDAGQEPLVRDILRSIKHIGVS